MHILQLWQHLLFWYTCTHAAKLGNAAVTEVAEDQCFTTHWVTIHSVGVMCKPWSNPKCKQWIISWMRNELHICILFASKYWAKRGNTVQGLTAACPFCIYREGAHSRLPFFLLHPEKENGRAKSFKFLFLFSQNIDFCFFRKQDGSWRFLLRLSCCI